MLPRVDDRSEIIEAVLFSLGEAIVLLKRWW